MHYKISCTYIFPLLQDGELICILFTHSNQIDFTENINMAFKSLNKWLRANELSLNFNKTNYVHFGTKRNMIINLKIGFNNNLIANSASTKFLGMTMNNNLNWNNHVDSITKKLSKACYMLRNAKICMSASSLIMIYYAFFHSIELWNYILGKLIT